MLDNPAAAKKAQVLIRITETVSKKTTQEQAFLDSVTKFNNTQNAIKISDFRSNDKIQHDIRAKFSELPSLGGKKFSYKNKRSGPSERDGKKGADISIGMEEFTKTLYAFLYGPDDVYGGTGHVFDATTEGGYAKLFGVGGEVLPALTNEMFEKYAGIWFVCNRAREFWKEESRKTKHSALERRWMFYFALGCVARKAYENLDEQYAGDLRKLSKPSWLNEGADGTVTKTISRQAKLNYLQVLSHWDRSDTEDKKLADQQALAYVVHFIGDIHQPLHAADRDGDRGGNAVAVKFFGSNNLTLHGIWDSQIVARMDKSPEELVTDLHPEISTANAEPSIRVVDWAIQSYTLARDVAYKGIPVASGASKTAAPVSLGQAYQDTAAPVVRLQIARAGIRLASHLQSVLQ